MSPFKNPFNIPDEHMRMVGIIACQWEHIEKTLEHTVAESMGHKPSRVGLLTMNIGFHTKCELILAYARAFEKEEPLTWKLFTSSIEHLHTCQKIRSEFVHASWHENETDREKPLRLILSTRGKRLTYEERSTNIQELYDAAETLDKYASSFILLMQECGLLLPYPQTPDAQSPDHSSSRNQGT